MENKILYQKLVGLIDIPVIETSEIRTKGIFLNKKGTEPKIYIKKGLEPPEKVQVLLHEFAHYLHLKKFHEDESRADCEIIAESTAFFILRELGINSQIIPISSSLTDDPERLESLTGKIKAICDEIMSMLR